jgi:hypothetical protein
MAIIFSTQDRATGARGAPAAESNIADGKL